MKNLIPVLLQERPLWIGTFGTLGTLLLDRISTLVGIAVGLATLVYLLLRIRRELK